MAKKSTGLLVRGARARKNATPTHADRIDFSDIPELTDEELKKMKRPGRPLIGKHHRHLIAIRMDPDVLLKLKAEAEEEGKGVVDGID